MRSGYSSPHSRRQVLSAQRAASAVSKSEKRARNKANFRAKQAADQAAARAKKAAAPPSDAPPLELPDYRDIENFELFCRDCLVIIDKRGQRVPFILNSTQRKILDRIRISIRAGHAPRKAILKSRQVGCSTLIEALLTWDAVMRADRSSLVIAHVLKSSKSLFRMSRNFHRFLDGAFKQTTRIQNVSEIEYDSGSRLQVEVQGEARAYTAQMLHLSEFGFYQRAKDTLVAVMQSVPNTPDSLVAIESTANGMGGIGEVFYRLCMRAAGLAADTDVPEDEKGWDLIFIPWFDHEEYEMEVRGNFYLTDVEKQLMRDHPEITRPKLKWRRWCISTNLDGDEELFAQEYPACVVAGTRVGTARGIIPVEDVVTGDETARGRVAHLFRQAESPIWTVRTAQGYEFSGTWDHPVFTEGGVLVPLSALKPGVRVQLQAPKLSDTPHVVRWSEGGVDCSVPITKDWCRFLGLFAGDGSMCGTTLSIGCDGKDVDVLAECVRLIESLFWVRPATRVVGTKKGGTEARVGSQAIRGVLERIGVVRDHLVGRPDRLVCVPECVWRSPRAHVREFLRALFEADGFVGKTGYVKLFSRHRRFLLDVQLLLLAFGITSRVASAPKIAGDGHHYEGNELCLRKWESDAFHKKIGFLSARKSDRSKTRKTRWNRAKPVTMADAVANVSVGPPAPTFDLTIEGGHAFDAGGILTHNTIREAFLLSGRPAFDVEAVTAYSDEFTALKLAGKLPPTCELDTEQPGVSAPNIIVRERGRLRIFFEPEERQSFVVGADPSEGDPGSDPSPLAVLCQQTMNLAAVWYGRTPPDVLALHAIDLAKHYNQALIIGEANNHGILFNETVLQIGYPNMYYREVSAESVAGEITNKPGYLAGTRTRQNMFNTLRKYVRMRMGKLYSPEIIQQIQTAVYEEDKVQAGVGSDKDLLVAFGLTLMAHRGSMQRPLVPLPDRVIRSVAAHAAGLKERDPGAADSYVLVATGMTQDEVNARMDAILAREVHQRKRGTGGMR